VLGGRRLHLLEHEDELDIQRLLAPQRTVVVEGRNALFRRDVVLPRLVGHRLDEGDDARLRRAVVPGGKRVLGLRDARKERERRKDDASKHA